MPIWPGVRWRSWPVSGRRRFYGAGWAAGVVYALGQANFLFDPAIGPTATADQLSEAFGVPKTTMGSKARQVRDLADRPASRRQTRRPCRLGQQPVKITALSQQVDEASSSIPVACVGPRGPARGRHVGHRAVSFTRPVSVTPGISPESGDDLSPSRR
jgi:Domain of unknown function (DUF6398)